MEVLFSDSNIEHMTCFDVPSFISSSIMYGSSFFSHRFFTLAVDNVFSPLSNEVYIRESSFVVLIWKDESSFVTVSRSGGFFIVSSQNQPLIVINQ